MMIGHNAIGIFKIADIITQIPTGGNLSSRCREYVYTGQEKPEIIIDPDMYCISKYSNKCTLDDIEYMESCRQFYVELLYRNGFYLHSSAVEIEGKAFLFSGNSGVGKSTHTKLWKQLFGDKAVIFNDDKPAIRFINNTWCAYGTPWCGKDGINKNMRVPIKGICFLKQSNHNKIRQLSNEEAIIRIVKQTIYRFDKAERLDLLISTISDLLKHIPVYELENKPDIDAALLSYNTMNN